MKRRPPSTSDDGIEDAVTGRFQLQRSPPGIPTSQDPSRDFSGQETEIGVPLGYDGLATVVDEPPPSDSDGVPSLHGPLQMISMKTPVSEPVPKRERNLPAVKLRVDPTPPSSSTRALGNLAPPRDAGEARARKLRDLAMWSALVVILASLVSIGIWLLAGRG